MERPVAPEVTVSSPTSSKQPKSHIPHSGPTGSKECPGEVVNINSSAASPITTCKTSLLHSFKTGKLKIKEEPGDEIKDYAETTMNELLGWYGYEHAVHKEDTQNLNLKMFQPANGEKGLPRSEAVPASSPGGSSSGESKAEADGAATRAQGGSANKDDHGEDKEKSKKQGPREESTVVTRNQTIVAALNIVPRGPETHHAGDSCNSPAENRSRDTEMPSPTIEGSPSPGMSLNQDGHEDGGAPCGMPETSPCLWCQKPTGDKPFSLKSEDGSVKLFCTDLCFTLCRRASFKKNKVCDWCKNVKNTVTYVDFQDGEQQLQFCSEQCLNQYKMNIFCKETQEHLQSIKTQMGSTVIPPQVTSKQIIITPELWKGYRGEEQSRQASAAAEASSTTDRCSGSTDLTTTPRSYPKEKEKRPDVSDRKHKLRGKSDGVHGERKSCDSRLTVNAASYLGNHVKPRLSSTVNGDMPEQFSSSRSYVDVGKNESKDSFQFSDKYLKSPKKEPVLFSPTYPRSVSKGSEGSLLGIGSKLFSSNPKDRAKHNSSGEGCSFGGYPLGASPDSELSSTPRSSVTSQVPQSSSGGPHSTSTTALPASHLLSSLGPGLPPWMYNPLLASSMAGLPGCGLGIGSHGMSLPGRLPGGAQGGFGINIGSSDSSNTQETRDTMETPQPAPTHVQGNNLPLRPPFPMGLGAAPTNLLGMVPPGLPPLLPMGPTLQNSYLPSMAGLGSAGILPPNTLLVPYPVILPLPVPLPLPIPIPIPCDKDGNPAIPGFGKSTPSSDTVTQIKQERDDGEKLSSQSRDSVHDHTCPNHVAADRAGPCTSKLGAKSCQITCACCQTEIKENVNTDMARVHSTSSPESYESPGLLDPHSLKHPPSHLGPHSSISSNSDFQNDVIDLSKDKHRSKGIASLPSLDLNRNNTMLNRSPSSGSDNSMHHYSLGGTQQNFDSAYSARRSLILDAPSMPKERNQHSPGVEKRLFIGGLPPKEHAYGKRRCIRPRIRTK